MPTLGVCLGHQLAAVALGGSVERNPSGRTIGPVPVRLTGAAASDPLLAGLDGLAAIHYNDDVVTEAPARARRCSRRCPTADPQALRFGPAAWGVQFHPETSPEVFGAWLRWDSPDGLTPEQEVLLGEVTAPRESYCGRPGSPSPRGSPHSSRRMPWRGVPRPSRPEGGPASTPLRRVAIASSSLRPHRSGRPGGSSVRVQRSPRPASEAASSCSARVWRLHDSTGAGDALGGGVRALQPAENLGG